MKRKRARYFRGLRVLLDCGHVQVYSTCMWRLDARRLSCIIGSINRGGTFCDTCRVMNMPVKYLGTTRSGG